MNRKQLYANITTLGLQGEVKARYGKNYTNCTSAQLQVVVDEAHKSLNSVNVGSIKGPLTKLVVDEAHKSLNSVNVGSIKGPLTKLVEVLAKKRILLKSEVDAIMNA